MLDKVIPVKKVRAVVNKLKDQGKKIVLVGGCFDILHPGHVIFLQKAKEQGDVLIILLESDEKVKKLKGSKRPVYQQKFRAIVLSALESVNLVVMLPNMEKPKQYDDLVLAIKPDVIATTADNKNITYLQRTANLAGAKLKLVTKNIANFSTTFLIDSSTIQ